MTLFEVNLKNGILFVGENGLLNVTKIGYHSTLNNDFQNKYPFLGNFYPNKNFGLKIGMGIAGHPNIAISNGYIWVCVEIGNYKNLVKNHLFDLKEDILNIYEFSDMAKYSEEKDCIFVSFERTKVREFFNVKRISKEVKEQLFHIAAEIAIKNIWNNENIVYMASYYAFNKENKKELLPERYNFYYGPSMSQNGIQEYIKTEFNEKFLKVISMNYSFQSLTYMKKLWKSICITPRILKKEIPEIIIKDYGEFFELKLDSEEEIFSKVNFSIELIFHDKGELGKKIQSLVRKRLTDLKNKKA